MIWTVLSVTLKDLELNDQFNWAKSYSCIFSQMANTIKNTLSSQCLPVSKQFSSSCPGRLLYHVFPVVGTGEHGCVWFGQVISSKLWGLAAFHNVFHGLEFSTCTHCKNENLKLLVSLWFNSFNSIYFIHPRGEIIFATTGCSLKHVSHGSYNEVFEVFFILVYF